MSSVDFAPVEQTSGWSRGGWLVIGLTLVGGLLRFAALGAKSLWLDEAFSLWMARLPLGELVAWSVRIDHHPPLYYALLHGWLGLWGEEVGAARALSALCSTLTIPIFAFAGARLVGRRTALWATLLLVVAPFHLRYAQEARMYALLTLAVAGLLACLGVLLTSPTRRWAWWGLAVCQAAAMLTHNTATVLVPLALNGAVMGLWWARRRGAVAGYPALASPHFMRAWMVAQAGALLLWSPWAWGFVRQAQVVDAHFWIEPPTWGSVWGALQNLTLVHLPQWLPWRDGWALGVLVAASVGAWRWGRRAAQPWLLGTLVILPPLVELAVSLRRPIFYDRTLIWTTLPLLWLVAHGLTAWPQARQKSAGLRAVPILALVLACSLAIYGYFAEFHKEPWDEVAATVAAQAAPGDLILFNASWVQLPFDYYYTRLSVPAGDAIARHGAPVDLFDRGELEPTMTQADVPGLRRLVAAAPRVWLVYSHWWYTDPDGLVPATLGRDKHLIDEWTWPGIRLQRYVTP